MDKIEEKKKNLQDEYRTNAIKMNSLEKEIYKYEHEQKGPKTALLYIYSAILYAVITYVSSRFGLNVFLETPILSMVTSVLGGAVLSEATIEGVKKINLVESVLVSDKEVKEKLTELQIELEKIEHKNYMIKNTFDTIEKMNGNIEIKDTEELVSDYQEALELSDKASIRNRLNYRFYKYREKTLYKTNKAITAFVVTAFLAVLAAYIPNILYGIPLHMPTIGVIPMLSLTASLVSFKRSLDDEKIYNRYNESLGEAKMDNNPDPKWIENHGLFRKPNELYVNSRLSLDETTIKRIENMSQDGEKLTLSDIYPKEEIIEVNHENIKEENKVLSLKK